MDRDGKSGVWFELETADELRRAHLIVPELKLQVATLEQIQSVRDAQLKAYVQALDEQKQATKEYRAELEETRRWYREPSLWAGIGAAFVTAIVVGLR
jgi:hypothetical protein